MPQPIPPPIPSTTKTANCKPSTFPAKKKLKDAYTVSEMSTATGLKLAPKDTPQSVSVITRKQMDDLGATTLEDALKTTTGMNIVRRGNYTQFQSRGFNINSITTNGLDSTISSLSGNNLHTGKQLTDTALYERVEVLRGGSGLKQAGSEPGGSVNAVLKRPTSQPLAEFEAQANRWGKVRGSADVSGVLSTEHGIRGRIVGVLERDRLLGIGLGQRPLPQAAHLYRMGAPFQRRLEADRHRRLQTQQILKRASPTFRCACQCRLR